MGTEGNFDKIGGSDALGFNVNVPWPHGGFGDLDYLAVWDHLLLPIAKDFKPDMVLISGGFDSGTYITLDFISSNISILHEY